MFLQNFFFFSDLVSKLVTAAWNIIETDQVTV